MLSVGEHSNVATMWPDLRRYVTAVRVVGFKCCSGVEAGRAVGCATEPPAYSPSTADIDRRRFLLAVGLVSAGVLLLAGCPGGDDEGGNNGGDDDDD